jgi:hypothetical protein
VMGPLLYWRRVLCSVGGIVGAAIAGMALSHAIARGVLAGLFYKTGVFQITAKGKAPSHTGSAGTLAAAKPRAFAQLAKVFAPAREEVLLLTALLLAIAAMAITRDAGHTESTLWMLMLALQALPYVASLLCAVAASFAELGTLNSVDSAPWFKRLSFRRAQ